MKLSLTLLKPQTLLTFVIVMTAVIGWVVSSFPTVKEDTSFFINKFSSSALVQELVRSSVLHAQHQQIAQSPMSHLTRKNCHSAVRQMNSLNDQSLQSNTIVNHSIHQNGHFVHKVHQMNDATDEKVSGYHRSNSDCCNTMACECPAGYCQSFTVIVQNFSIIDSMLSMFVLTYQSQLLLAHSEIPFRPPISLS